MVWSNEHIKEWVCEIGLGDHAHCLNESGIHGGVVALDNDLDHEKLALALQIPLSSFEVGYVGLPQSPSHLLPHPSLLTPLTITIFLSAGQKTFEDSV